MVSSNNFKFLIMGPGRGGTSLLTGLLDNHSILEVGFELFTAKCLMGQSFISKLFHRKNKLIYDRLRAFRKACIKESRKFPGKIWGNKVTTEQLYGLEDHNIANPNSKVNIINIFFRESVPDIKIIFIIRDGRTCIRSKIARTGQPLELACSRWKFAVEAYRYLKEVHSNNIIVRFEDLIENPRVVLVEICAFLGISFEEKMLEGTENRKIPQEYRNKTFDKTKISLDNIPEECYPFIADELKYCGYL